MAGTAVRGRLTWQVAAVPISGLTAWQGLFDHAELKAGQTLLIHGAVGGVGSIAVQLAHELGARVIGTGRAADREVRVRQRSVPQSAVPCAPPYHGTLD